jgi:hypothetical protein
MSPRPGAPCAHAALLAAGLAGLLAACTPTPTPTTTGTTSSETPVEAPAPARADSGAPPAIDEIDREIVALAFIAYTGEKITGSDQEVSQKLVPCFEGELAKQPLVEDWELVWGPVVYRFKHVLYNDNLLYAVRRRDDPTTIAVSTRGTNSPALFDWLIEDLGVFRLRDWPYGDPGELEPKIDEGTWKGFEALQGLVPPEGVPGDGKGISAFLGEQVAANAPKRTTIHVTGHSLGGALSPVLALWLADTRAEWDPNDLADLHVAPFAGPTQGDADFAAYYDQRLGTSTTRFHDAVDLATLIWATADMATIPNLYLPVAKMDEAERIALDALILGTEDKGYRQILADQPPLAYREVNPDVTSFLDQADWQHHCGYVCGLGVQETLLPVSEDCMTTPANPCPQCPGS